MRKYLILAALVLVLAVAVPFLNPQPTANIPFGVGCSWPPAPNWNLGAGGCTCQNDDLTINGSVIVSGAGVSLTMDNCTIRFNCTAPLACGMLVQNGGMLTMDNRSVTINATTNPYTFRILGPANTMAAVINSTVSGAGASSGNLALTGLYADPSGVGPIILQMANSTVINGYRGVVVYDSSFAAWNSIRVMLLNNTIVNNSDIGIYNYKINGTVIQENIVNNNGPYGIRIRESWGVLVKNNTVSYNNGTGISVQNSNLTLRNITYNYIYKNNGDGIFNLNPLDGFDIRFNTILNNSGWGVFSLETGSASQCIIRNNTMCYNTNTTYWTSVGGADYGGVPPQGNKFCVNVSKPVKGGCTNSDEVKFNVSGNPISWCTGCGAWNGMSNCTLNIDNIYQGFTLTPGAYHEASITFNGTAIGDGYHNVSVRCDPYDNTADDDRTDFIRDTVPPSYDNQSNSGGGGTCGTSNINLAVRWTDSTCNVSYITLSTNETHSYMNYTNGTYGSPIAAGWKANWTNFSWWNESIKNNWINWFVWANDSAGNENKSSNATFLASPCTTESVVVGGSPGGGGLGGGIEPYSCYKTMLVYTFNNVPVGTYSNVNYTKYCHEMRLDSFYTSAAGNAKFTIKPLDNGTAPPEGKVYRYYDASIGSLNQSISQVKVGFGINNSWLSLNNVAYSDIKIFGFNGTDWKEIIRRNAGSDENATYYQADVILPATLAVVGIPECPQCPVPSNWSACVEGNQTRSAYACSANTSYVCAPAQEKRPCAPECSPCPATISGRCVDSQKRSMYFYCNESTQFLCANYTAAESCGITAFPQINLPQLMAPKNAVEWIQTVSFAGVLAVIIALGAFYVFRVRKKAAIKTVAKKPVEPKPKAKPVKAVKAKPVKPQKVNAKKVMPEEKSKINSQKKNTKKVR